VLLASAGEMSFGMTKMLKLVHKALCGSRLTPLMALYLLRLLVAVEETDGPHLSDQFSPELHDFIDK